MRDNINISDIKQYLYCPRKIFFSHVCPVPRKNTYKMEHGRAGHLELDKLEKRRTLKRYSLAAGQRVFHTWLQSDRLGLQGKLDMHIVVKGRHFTEYLPVEFKFTGYRAALDHKYQVVGYAMLLEDHYRTTVRDGLLYLVPRQEIIPVAITPDARAFVLQTRDKIWRIIAGEQMPGRQRNSRKCCDCECRRFCGDIDLPAREKDGVSDVFFH